MASITIRNLDESVKTALRKRAAANSRSMEEEARHLLKAALLRDRFDHLPLGQRLQAIAREFNPNGYELEIPPRSEGLERNPPTFDEEQ